MLSVILMISLYIVAISMWDHGRLPPEMELF